MEEKLDKYDFLETKVIYIITKEECQEKIEIASTVIDEIEKYIDKNK